MDAIPADRSFPTPQLRNKKTKLLVYLQATDSWLDVRDPTHEHFTHNSSLLSSLFWPSLPSTCPYIITGDPPHPSDLMSLVQFGKVCARCIFQIANGAEQTTSEPSDLNQQFYFSCFCSLGWTQLGGSSTPPGSGQGQVLGHSWSQGWAGLEGSRRLYKLGLAPSFLKAGCSLGTRIAGGKGCEVFHGDWLPPQGKCH